MKRIPLLFVLWSLLFFSCQEEVEPETVFGRYVVQSIVADQAIDLSGEGVPAVDLLSQFESMRIWQQSIFVSLYSTRDFNVGYPQVVFTIPFQLDEDPKLGFGNGSFGRRADISSDGRISLDWSLAPDFPQPDQLHQSIWVEEIRLLDNADKELEVVLHQTFFDQAQREWVQAKVIYQFLLEES
jgi:hypothetical protein